MFELIRPSENLKSGRIGFCYDNGKNFAVLAGLFPRRFKFGIVKEGAESILGPCTWIDIYLGILEITLTLPWGKRFGGIEEIRYEKDSF